MTDNQIFDPDARSIPYLVEGEGRDVVLIAGKGLEIGYLGLLAHSLTQAHFRVIRIGSRGASDGEPAALSDLAQDVVDVLDHVGVHDAWVGGHAFGGSVARAVSLSHHDRVNGVLLLGVDASDQSGALAPGIPVLVIQGTDDLITPPSHGDDLRAAAPDRVSVVTVEGGGHMFPATHVGATSWAIEDYLDWD